MRIIFSLCLLLLSQVSLASLPVTNNITAITKSENDDRSYRYLVLPNHLQVLLISDPTTEKSAAALDINIGSGEDPQSRPGLAHFLEHMLFLGTKKYPKAGEYQEYISAHSGSNNAYTSLEHTNYHFDIDPQYLEPALDRFAQFFIAPLLDENYVTRERNAVHSEYAAKIKDESRRGWDVMSVLTNPANKSARFSVGTLGTLSDYDRDGSRSKVRNDLLKFYQAYYSANLMTLVVLGKESPDQLEQMIKTRFSEIMDKKIELSRQEVPLFPDGFLPRTVYIKPLQDQRILSLSFPIPVFEQFYREKPVTYISYMLGHEGTDSAYDILRNKGWIESLAAGPDISNRQSADFSISLVLTREGYLHQRDIIDIVYGAVERLKKEGIEKWRYNEQSVISDTLFRFQEKGDVLYYVSTLANNLHYYQPQDVIAGMTMMTSYDEALIRRYLGYLKPENTLIEINAPDVPVTKTSPYYQTQYSVSKTSDDDLKRWSKRVANEVVQMPTANEYVAKQLRVKKAEDNKATIVQRPSGPTLLRSNPNLRLWFKQDKYFNVPRGGVYIYARSMQSVQGVEGAALTELFVRLLNDNLNSHAYNAELAGLGLTISRRSRGLAIEITGYSDKQGLLLTRVLDAIISPTFKQKDFDSVKEGLLRELANQNSQTPYRQLNRELRAVISKAEYETGELIPAVKKIQMSHVQEFALSWLKSLNADVLIHGNFVESDALKFSAIIENKFALQGKLHRDPQGLFGRLPESQGGLLYPVMVDHRDVAVMHYVQGVDNSVAELARMRMLVQLMETEFYQQLRTEQQLGYVVYAGDATMAQVPGLVFVVQSPSYSAEDIDARISDFFANFAKTLAAMPKDDFERYRSALLKTVEEKPRNLGEEGGEYWSEITNRYLVFDLREQLISQIKLLNQKTMADYYWKAFLSPSVHKLVIVSSTKAQPLSKKLKGKYHLIDNLENFKKNQEYFILE